MLIEFSVANFKSIKDEVRLSLVAGPGKEFRETHVVTPRLNEGVRSIPLLRSAAVYGANAAGKTNLLRALWTMRDIVALSSRDLGGLPVTPFRFDPDCEARPTTFEAMCFAEGVRYQYGFSATRDAVAREWLYAWPRGRVQLWFERERAGNGGDRFKFGDRLSGDKEVWRRATRPDALFLSTAVSLNSSQLRPVFDWFTGNLHVAGVGGWVNTFSLEYCRDGRKDDLLEFLRSADLAISGLRVVEREFSPEALPDDMPPAVQEDIGKKLAGAKVVNLRLRHDAKDGRPVELDLDEESDGTQKIFALSGPWLDTLENGHVIVFDELHDNLHPSLVRFLVERFHDPGVNAKGAQLVFSTHDTSILSQDVFRRDQIWFCERNARQETGLFPLTDFRPRKGIENLERSYLGGRYGAVPHLPRFQRKQIDTGR